MSKYDKRMPLPDLNRRRQSEGFKLDLRDFRGAGVFSFHSLRECASRAKVTESYGEMRLIMGKRNPVILVIALFFLNGSSVFLQAKDLKKVFLDEYGPEVEKLINYYSKVVIKARRVDRGFPNQNGELLEEILYMSNGPLHRLEVVNISQKGDLTPNTKRVWVANPRISFTLKKSPEKKEFVIIGLEKEYEKQIQRIRLNGVVPFCAYCFFELKLSDFASRINVNSINRADGDSESVVRLNYSREMPVNLNANVKSDNKQVGEFSFLSNNFWALKGYSLGSIEDPAAARESIGYETKIGKLPVIKKFESWREDRNGKQLRSVTIDVIDFISKEVDKEEFEFSSFGLPDPQSPETKTWHLWLGLAGIMCLVLGVYFRFLKRRSTTKT
jgi:hypothetical protein